VKIEVASSDDVAALYLRYIELVDSGRELTLEVAFAPGIYGVASIGPIRLDLGGNPPPKDPKIDVILRGVSADPPAVLRDLGVLVTARSLRLEDLILTGRSQGLLEARVARSFAMARCVVAHNVWGGPWGGALMRVLGVHGRPAYAVEIEDSWFVRNGQEAEAALLAIGPATGSFVEEVALRRVTFLENTTHGDLVVDEARAIRADDVLAVKDHAGGAAVLRHARTQLVELARSTFVVDDPAAVAFEDTRTWRSGMALTGSEIRASGRPRGAALDEVVAELTRRIPDPTVARARLREALGLH
jgi:hypothetical protein